MRNHCFDYNSKVGHFRPEYRSFKSIFNTVKALRSLHALRTHALAQLDWELSRSTRQAVDSSGPLPWLPYSCIQFLDQVVAPDFRVLEIGGGSSTLWWLARGHNCTTIETDPVWGDLLRNRAKAHVDQFRYEVVEESAISGLLSSLNQTFDIVLNDGHGDRNTIIDALTNLLSDRGFLVWDNSDRTGADEILKELKFSGFHVLNFFGLGPINAYCFQTSVIFRHPIVPQGRETEFKTIEY